MTNASVFLEEVADFLFVRLTGRTADDIMPDISNGTREGNPMGVEIRKLSVDDGQDIYEMLQELPADENGFVNSVNGKTYSEYQAWLQGAAGSAEQTGLIDGWKVPQTTFWLFENGRPVGIGKVRHLLTDALREHGGNVGYAIRPSARNRGLGKEFLALLADECKRMGVPQMLLTIQNHNLPSIRVALANGGRTEKVTEERHYIRIDL